MKYISLLSLVLLIGCVNMQQNERQRIANQAYWSGWANNPTHPIQGAAEAYNGVMRPELMPIAAQPMSLPLNCTTTPLGNGMTRIDCQ